MLTADQATLQYGSEVELVVASVVRHCVAREDNRPLVQQQLLEIFLRDLPIDDACLNELNNKEELCVLVDASKIALKRMYKGFKQSLRVTKSAENVCVCGKNTLPKLQDELHREDRPKRNVNACSEFDKRFASPALLNRHKMVHIGERPHSCGHCPMKFRRKDTLREHQLRRHGKVPTGPYSGHGPKPLKCDVCSATFYRKIDLVRHKLRHTGVRPYKCGSCAKRFARKDTLNMHQKLHSGKLMACGVCGKEFRVEKYLSQHMHLHAGLKPHKCGICNKEFPHKYYLASHLKKTHYATATSAEDEAA